MRFMQIELVLQTKNRSEPAKNWFSVALVYTICQGTLGINGSHLVFNIVSKTDEDVC